MPTTLSKRPAQTTAIPASPQQQASERASHHSQRAPFRGQASPQAERSASPNSNSPNPSSSNSSSPNSSSSNSKSKATSPVSAAPQGRDNSKAEPLILSLNNVSKLYRQGSCGLKNVNLALPKGSFLFVTGPSGSGKTTLLKLLYGAERPSEGSITVNNQEIQGLKGDRLSRFRRQLGVVFQDYKLIPSRTVSENVAFALWAQGCKKADIARRLAPTLRLVGLQHKAECFPHQLSGGEQQRVSLARAIVGTPPLILADEPTGNLDPENSQQVIRILSKLNAMGATVVVTTHDLHLVKQSQHPVIQINAGKLSWLRK